VTTSRESVEPRAERSFPADVTSAEAARRFVEAVLVEWRCEGFRDDALLLISELVTNAVTHAASECRVAISHLDGGIRFEVHDLDRAHIPVALPLDITSHHGRGLLIVDRTADLWGSEPTHDGKVVWFELRQPR
jgi:anti-sigma regulatory factor (Ser/Thr protein kinase)